MEWRLMAMLALAAGTLALGQAGDPVRASLPVATAGSAARPLFDLHESEIKFSVAGLMHTLRDGSHEGWVLAAYPDPKTQRPLIGAGFSLDLPAREHPQNDPLNPHPFLEPSSAELWQAAGLEPDRLERMLDRYERHLKEWKAKSFRRKLKAHALVPELTDEEATRLLRISAIQAIYNAKAYCRGFDALSASQQMALSQLVFQMGVNLEEFVQFLAVLNAPSGNPAPSPAISPGAPSDPDHWKTVQATLIASQWARLYTRRASTVIAMFDPAYSQNPAEAQARVNAVLHPAVVHRRKSGHAGSLRVAKAPRKGGSHAQRKRKVG